MIALYPIGNFIDYYLKLKASAEPAMCEDPTASCFYFSVPSLAVAELRAWMHHPVGLGACCEPSAGYCRWKARKP